MFKLGLCIWLIVSLIVQDGNADSWHFQLIFWSKTILFKFAGLGSFLSFDSTYFNNDINGKIVGYVENSITVKLEQYAKCSC